MTVEGPKRLTLLLKWFRDHGVFLHDVEVKADDQQYSGDAWGVFPLKDIPERYTLAIIPKTAVLSVKNSSISDFLETNKIGGGLGLVMAVMHEAALGESSKWHGYIQSLPPREYIPLFWDSSELELLRGTDAELQAKQARIDTEADYKDEIEPLLEKDNGALFDKTKMTLEHFRIAASWIGSRAFGVDDYHGMSMVPFADLFNHKSSIVSLSPEYVLEGACLAQDHSEEDESDAEHIQSDNEGFASEEVSRENKGEEEEECVEEESDSEEVEEAERPSICSATTRGEMINPQDFPDQDLRLHIGICGAERNGQDVLEIVAACPLAQGQEILNTFGELGNSELVSKYGFALPNNPFSNVHLRKNDLLSESRKILVEEQYQDRISYLEDQSNLLEDDEEPFEILPLGCIGPALLASVQILGCSKAEWQTVKQQDLTEALAVLMKRGVNDSKNDSKFGDNTIQEKQPSKRQKLEAPHDTGLDQVDEDESLKKTEDFELQNVRIRDAPESFLPQSVIGLLLACIQKRLGQLFSHGQSENLQDSLREAQTSTSRGEKASARIAALTLVLNEISILTEAQRALKTRQSGSSKDL